VSTLTTLIQYSVKNLSQSNQVREQNKMDTNRKERSQIITIFRQYGFILKRPKMADHVAKW
jgi:hypothetical protein